MRRPVYSSAICDVQHPDFLLVLLSMAIHQHRTGELTGWLLHIAWSSLSDWHCCFSRSFSFTKYCCCFSNSYFDILLATTVVWYIAAKVTEVVYLTSGYQRKNLMPKVKRFLVPSTILGTYVKRYYTFGSIYLFTNRVITHFGSDFLKISRDFAELGVWRT